VSSSRGHIATFLHSASRFIQFRSELAILMVLAAAMVVGLALRELLPVRPGPSAAIAGPNDRTERRDTRRRDDSRPAPAPPASPDVVGVR
jgi:hypothetical protein